MILIFIGASFYLVIFPPTKMEQFTVTQYRLFGGILFLYAIYRSYKVYLQYFKNEN